MDICTLLFPRKLDCGRLHTKRYTPRYGTLFFQAQLGCFDHAFSATRPESFGNEDSPCTAKFIPSFVEFCWRTDLCQFFQLRCIDLNKVQYSYFLRLYGINTAGDILIQRLSYLEDVC